MASNQSSKEKTIKTMMDALPQDTWNRDKELFYGNYNGLIIGSDNILNNFRDYFDQFLVDADVPEKFFYQPAAFAEFYYGTPDLDYLVLYFANMMSLFEFNKEKIKVLPRSRLVEYNKLLTTYKDKITESHKNPEKII